MAEVAERAIREAEPPTRAAASATVACPYCGGLSTHLVSSTDHNRHTTRDRFDYYRCSRCALIFLHAPPADLSPFYAGGYDPIPADYAGLRSIAAAETFRTDPVLRYKTSGRFLEIGPWRGVICSNMKEAGFEVTAIEMDPACVTFLRDHAGVRAIQSADPAEAMKYLEPGFAVIAAWHSLEHLPHPWRVIEQAARLLAPGGVLLLAMPNPDSFEFAVMKGRWMHLDAPRHLYFYTLPALLHLCGQHGLTPLEVTTADTFSLIQSRHAWYKWASTFLPIRYVRGAVARLLYWAAYRRQMQEGRGSAYTAIFVRSQAAGGTS